MCLVKHLLIMANVSLRFLDNDNSGTELECYLNVKNEITIKIEGDGVQYISLDKSTAIKLSKTLRTEINKINF